MISKMKFGISMCRPMKNKTNYNNKIYLIKMIFLKMILIIIITTVIIIIFILSPAINKTITMSRYFDDEDQHYLVFY